MGVGSRMRPTLGALLLLRAISEGPATRDDLLSALQEELGVRKNERTLRRYLAVLREAGFEISRSRGRYELRGSPVRLAFTNHETLATLNVVESLAERDPVYGEHLASASLKLREALPKEAVRFADSGRVVFDLSFANDPPENSEILDTLRRAAHHNQKAEIYYYSLASASWSCRTIEPLRIFYAQRAHRLYAHEPGKSGLTEFRVNRIKEARMLPDKFSPLAHIKRFELVEVRLSEKAFVAYGKTVVPDDSATIEPLEEGGAVVRGTTPSVFWTVREIASLGPEAAVLGGPKLKEELQRFLKETLAKYS
jgi:predicted DNA-binding transcriptional regulator YafY